MQPANVDYAIRAFVTLLAIVDPLGNVPFFLTATQRMNALQRRVVDKVFVELEAKKQA